MLFCCSAFLLFYVARGTKILKSCGFPGTRALIIAHTWSQWGGLSTISTCKYMSTTASFPRMQEMQKEKLIDVSAKRHRVLYFGRRLSSLQPRTLVCPILKVQPPICLDYRARNRPQLIGTIILKAIKYKSKNGEFEMNL